MLEGKTIIEISCFEVWRRISDFVDDDVEPELRQRLEFHFGRCKHCKALLDGTQNVIALIGDEHAFEIPRETSHRITSALLRRIEEDGRDERQE
ncbi:MAG: zf-HC2 domain-containing protein [Acidobacteriales bacterium]|nr:zf-HC2 domain-containing protein [Terriglobales bacterium]